MDYRFSFYLASQDKRVDVVEKDLWAAAKKCREEQGVENIALSGVALLDEPIQEKS